MPASSPLRETPPCGSLACGSRRSSKLPPLALPSSYSPQLPCGLSVCRRCRWPKPLQSAAEILHHCAPCRRTLKSVLLRESRWKPPACRTPGIHATSGGWHGWFGRSVGKVAVLRQKPSTTQAATDTVEDRRIPRSEDAVIRPDPPK